MKIGINKKLSKKKSSGDRLLLAGDYELAGTTTGRTG